MADRADTRDDEEELGLGSKAISEPCLQRKMKRNDRVAIVQRLEKEILSEEEKQPIEGTFESKGWVGYIKI